MINCAGKPLPFKNKFESVTPSFKNLTQDVLQAMDKSNKKVIFKVDNDTPVRFEIPSSNECYYEYFKAPIGELELTKGAHYLSIICDDEIRFHEVSYYKSSKTHPLFEHDLSDYVLVEAGFGSDAGAVKFFDIRRKILNIS